MIVISRIALDNAQTDGRRVIIETHVDDQDIVYEISYMADKDTDILQHLADSADQLNADLAYAKENAAQLVQQAIDDIQQQIDVLQENLAVAQTELSMVKEGGAVETADVSG